MAVIHLPNSDAEHLPASALQRALAAEFEFDPGGSAYNIAVGFVVDAEFDASDFRQAVESLVEAHSSLRTTFFATDSQVQRRIAPHATPEIQLLASASDGAAAVTREFVRRPFDILRAPPVRFGLISEPGSSTVLIAAHHAVSDYESQGILARELLQLMLADQRERPRCVVTNADSAYERFAKEHSELQVSEFYRRVLEEDVGLPNLDLAPSRPRPGVRSLRGETVELSLSRNLLNRARAVARDLEVPSFSVLLAAAELTYARRASQRRFWIAVPVNLRDQLTDGNVVGPYINTIPLPVDVRLDATLRSQILSAAGRITRLNQFRAEPLTGVVSAVAARRDASRASLAQVAFGYQPAFISDALLDKLLTREPFEWSGRLVTGLGIAQQEGQFDLALEVVEGTEVARLSVRYRSDIFGADDAADIGRQYVETLTALVSDADAVALPIVRVLEGKRTSPPSRQVPGTIRMHCEQTPDAVALKGETPVSYGELGRYSARLARRLQPCPAAPVALLLPRGSALAMSVLGVWFSGRSFVPIDPAYPPSRVAFMLRDSGAQTVLTVTALRELIPEGPYEVVELDSSEDLQGQGGTLDGVVETAADADAYVVYTSGTTGLPKGVRIEHGSLANLAQWQREYFAITADDVVFQFASPSFDAYVWELVLALHAGASLACPTDASTLAGPELITQLQATQPTVLTVTPSALSTIDVNEAPESLHTVVLAGESVPTGLARDWVDRVGLYNAYGPTEATICSSIARVAEHVAEAPIGWPIDNAILAIDPSPGSSSPSETRGELLIGGALVAAGYIGGSAKSDRFLTIDGVRYYRTGDQVAVGETGLRFLGRLDRQVKLRGFRVELGEIERWLLSTRGTMGAAVVVGGPSSHEQLIAYFVGDTDESSLRIQAERDLPSHLRPQWYVAMNALPMTVTGKVDYSSLPELDHFATQPDATSRAPLTGDAAVVAAVWTQVLGVAPAVGSDFFLLGGDSLTAARVASLVSARMQKAVSVSHVLSHPRLSDFSRLVSELDALPPYLGGRAFASGPGERQVTTPLSATQRAYWVGRGDSFDLGGVGTLAYVELDRNGPFDVDRFKRVVNQTVRNEDVLRSVLNDDDEIAVLPEVPEYLVDVHDLSIMSGPEREQALRELRLDRQSRQLDPRSWPNFSVEVSLIGSQRAVLHFVFDGVLIDGPKLIAIIRELARAYSGAPTAQPMPVGTSGITDRMQPPLGIAEQYWTERLLTLPDAPELPKARLAFAGRGSFSHRSRRLDRSIVESLRQKARAERVTLPSVLLFAYGEALSQWSTSPDFTLNVTTRANGQEATANHATDLLLLEMHLGRAACIGEGVRDIQSQLRADLDHASFSAIDVLRLRARKYGDVAKGQMPVVFTSLLDQDASSDLGVLSSITTTTPQVSLDHVAFIDREELVVLWNSRDDLFEPGVLDEVFARYIDILESLARQQWDEGLTSARATDATTDGEACGTGRLLHSAVFESAEAHPDRTAIVQGTVEVSYGELLQRANAIAGTVARHLVGPEEVVAIIGKRSWRRIAAVLGVLKAGAAYLPVDPSLPAQRVAAMLSDANVSVVVTTDDGSEDPQTADLLPSAQFVSAKRAQAEFEPEEAQPLDPECLAYLIYTSGSTGKPKGVMIEHRSAENTISDLVTRYSIDSQDAVLAISELAFDLSVFDIFALLGVGGRVVLPAFGRELDPSAWAEAISNHGVTIWNSVPALLEMLLSDCEDTELLRALRLAMVSGDRVPASLIQQVNESTSAMLLSLGGATEASIWSIYFEAQALPQGWDVVPYGQSLAGQTVSVRDSFMRKRPPWAIGEICIGGQGLARGYLNDDVRTKQSFVSSPSTGERIYKTGDFGRLRPDGLIEFLGRRDAQVKVNGHRLELGEVEAALARIPSVSRAAVVAVPNEKGAVLTAFVVPNFDDSDAAGWRVAPTANVDWPTHESMRLRAEHLLEESLAPAISQFAKFEVAAEAFALVAMSSALDRAGLFADESQSHSTQEVMTTLRVDPRFQHIVRKWLDCLVSDGWLEKEGELLRATTLWRPEPQESTILLERSATWGPDAWLLADYLKRSSSELHSLVSGDVNAAELLFPGGSLEVADALYSRNPISEYCNRMVGEVVARLLGKAQHDGSFVRILELGAGTGSTSQVLLPLLPPTQVKYIFSDISEYLLSEAKKRFGQYPFVEFVPIDLDALGYAARDGEFDIIIATNVLHDARDVSVALANLNRVLAPEGALIFTEGTSANRMQLVSLGFLEGLASSGEAYEEASALASEQTWVDRACDAGFASAVVPAGASVTGLRHLSQSVIVAQSAKSGRQLNEGAIRESLRDELPPYAIPGSISAVRDFPLTQNGKVDRSALATAYSRGSAPRRRGPRTGSGGKYLSVVIDIWRDVLGNAVVEADSDLYEIGGDSLTAIRIAASLQKRIQIKHSSRVRSSPTKPTANHRPKVQSVLRKVGSV